MRFRSNGCLLALLLVGCTSPQWAVRVVNDTGAVVPVVGLQLQWDSAHPEIGGACQDLAPGNSMTVTGDGGATPPTVRLRVQWQAGAEERAHVVPPQQGETRERVLSLSVYR